MVGKNLMTQSNQAVWGVMDEEGCSYKHMQAVGAREIFREDDDTNHLHGTARMGDDPRTSVVNADCRSWDIPNLWVCDGSVFPTVGGVNPSETIQAIALRTADRIKHMAGRRRVVVLAEVRRGTRPRHECIW